MAILCLNCKSSLGCGCNKRTASNGASVCVNCLGQYEANLKKTANQGPAPSNVKIFFNRGTTQK